MLLPVGEGDSGSLYVVWLETAPLIPHCGRACLTVKVAIDSCANIQGPHRSLIGATILGRPNDRITFLCIHARS